MSDLIKTAIAQARRSIEATLPEANVESTFQAMSSLLRLLDITPEDYQALESELRAQLEEGLKIRKEPTH